MNDQLINLRQIVNTMKLMTITSARMQDHGTIVGDWDLAVELDTLALQVQNTALVAEQLLGMLVGDMPTEEVPVVAAS